MEDHHGLISMFQIRPLLQNFPKRGYLAIGIMVRLIVAPFLSHPFDMRIFMAVGAAVARGMTPYGQYVLQDMFAEMTHPHLFGTFPGIGYPPFWGLISGFMFFLSSAISSSNPYVYVFALKTPVILAELALAFLVYKILKTQTDEKTASKAFFLFLFCPFIIAVGTVWGMFDVLALFFVVLSAYALHNNWKLSCLYLAVASVLKVFPLVLVPLYSLLLYKSTRNIKSASGFFLLVVGFASVFTIIPMMAFAWPVVNLYNAVAYHVTTTNPSYDNLAAFPYGAASPFNVFSLVNNLSGEALQLPSFFVYLWIPACIAVYVLLWRVQADPRKVSFAFTVKWSLLLLLVLFTTRVWVSEQNLIFVFGFLALAVFLLTPNDSGTAHMLWMLLLSFVMVHVPAIAFLWLPLPWTLTAATSFADGPLGWTRLLLMSLLTIGWLVLSWRYVTGKLRWEI